MITMATVIELVTELVSELPAEDAAVVPLPLVRRIINDHLSVQWDRAQQYAAVKAGTIRPLGGNNSGLKVDRNQAKLIIAAAVLAESAQAPVVTMLRALQILREDRAMTDVLTQAA